MENKYFLRTNSGLDSFLRITNTLRRKNFKVKNLSMSESDVSRFINVFITVDDEEKRAYNYISKLADVYEIRQVSK